MKIVELYDGSLFECQMLKNLFENAGIESYLKDELIGTRSPGWRPGGGVKIMISDINYEKAKPVVTEFERTKKGI